MKITLCRLSSQKLGKCGKLSVAQIVCWAHPYTLTKKDPWIQTLVDVVHLNSMSSLWWDGEYRKMRLNSWPPSTTPPAASLLSCSCLLHIIADACKERIQCLWSLVLHLILSTKSWSVVQKHCTTQMSSLPLSFSLIGGTLQASWIRMPTFIVWKPCIGKYFCQSLKLTELMDAIVRYTNNAQMQSLNCTWQAQCKQMYQIGLLSYCCNLLLRTSHCLPPKCACRPACSISAHY